MAVNNNPNNAINQPLKATSGTTVAKDVQAGQIRVSRELDGLNNTGVIGELLTIGTANLSEANKYFAMGKFSVSGLLAEDNQAVSSAARLFQVQGQPDCGVLCADDMYVAGDPGVGGKGNNYTFNDVNVNPGFYTMFEDGREGGPKMTVNSHVDTINPEGDKAFTEYGFVIQDKDGVKTQAMLSGGVLTLLDANGQSRKLLPGQEYTVGNGTPPTAKFYYADVPGAGENGATEKRLMVDYYETPSQEAVAQLVAQGVRQEDAEQLISKTTFSYGFRTPDGTNTYAMSEGVGAGAALNTLPNGVKTYYDSHYSEGNCTLLDIVPCLPPPPPVAADEQARIWGDPHIVEADGGKYDFDDKGLFNVLKDQGVALNAQMSQGPGKTSVISKSGLTIGGRTVLIEPDGKVSIGYTDPNITTPPVTLANNQTVLLDNGYSVTRNGAVVTADTTSGEYKIRFDTDESYKGYKYMNIDIWSKAGGVLSDGEEPAGLLGETFDDDDTPQTSMQNSASSYQVASLLENGSTPATNTGAAGTTANNGTTPATNTGAANTANTTTASNNGTTSATNTGAANTANTTANTTTATPPPLTPPVWNGNIGSYLSQLISWLMRMLSGT